MDDSNLYDASFQENAIAHGSCVVMLDTPLQMMSYLRLTVRTCNKILSRGVSVELLTVEYSTRLCSEQQCNLCDEEI